MYNNLVVWRLPHLCAQKYNTKLTLLKKPFPLSGGIFDWDNAWAKLNQLHKEAESPTLWDDPSSAQKILKERENLGHSLEQVRSMEQILQDSIELWEMAELESDETTQQSCERDIIQLAKDIHLLRLQTLLCGEADHYNCFLEINAGAGGTEAQDWCQMLSRMYMRWAESRKFKVEIVDELVGEEAGLKSITLHIKGHQAYGWSKTESGIHRLVRISPFDSNAKRHTSFASVWVSPEVDDSIDIVIEDKDLRVDTYRASGAGGQHVNKTESAIRITHMPTGLVVQCQNDRSQHRNRAQAMSMLKAKLYEKELREREEKSQASQNKTDIGWGHQIRSYVLHPYQMVKDNRTGVEKGNAAGVLDGDLDDFLQAALAERIGS